MKIINVGIAGCLGRMGRELVKETIRNNRINFSGGFESNQHKNLHNKISDLIEISSDHIVSNDPNKIFSESDVFSVSDLVLLFTCFDESRKGSDERTRLGCSTTVVILFKTKPMQNVAIIKTKKTAPISNEI